jgi:anaerobic magnesium-protoporphyrin IX monomethyl ester cyclase
MKIAVIYPPIRYGNEYPLLSQNRQFKYTNSLEVRIYPVVMSSLATMLDRDGHNVLYLDGINERLGMEQFEKILTGFQPELVVMETKAPIILKHWEYLGRLKALIPSVRTILVGDHVCFFPEESLEQEAVDFVVRHGDYDFVVRDLARYLSGLEKAMPGSVFWKEKGIKKNSGYARFYDLNDAPQIDRDLTKWSIYGEAYLYHPVAYILSGRGCGGPNNKASRPGEYRSSFPGRCTFCIWQYAFWKAGARLRKPELVVAEIKDLVERYKVKEVFDDNESGGVWNIEWLKRFYVLMKENKLTGKVRISTNARADSLQNEEICVLLKKCGYRLLKIGVESANNSTLKKLKKDETIEQIEQGVRNAKKHGLVVLLTTMVGYPWENEEDALKTYEITRRMMLYKTHFGDSLQASIVVTYPGTPLYKEAVANNWLTVNPTDYEKFDMAHTLLKTNIDTGFWCKKMWRIHLNPVFVLKSFLTLRSINDIILAFRGLISLFGHLNDYKE